ncbi:replicative DNA helicase [Amaricoccus solimangrovi]|uniref:DNA 5'-3' helicase n=1 Tax=Amaricoccus solimangrovi TaxID=2589815 RepID=A0A501WWG1_9RHOB|nr:DnaB-like helicase C-terminal domain-containing protein [Amaricoccus solimangrovi]TPE53062.1 replicative DNA helicase [Amaricoccus solimangrovi]
MADSPLENIGAEQNLLGSILLNNDVLPRVSGLITAEDFADPVHGRIFAAIQARAAKDQLADAVTLRAMMADDAGLADLGPEYLARLAGAAISIFAAPDYARLIAGLAKKRRLAAMLSDALEGLGDADADADAILGQVEAFGLSQERRGGAEIISFMKAAGLAVVAASAAHTGETLPGVPTGVERLDEMLGGFHAGELIVLGGRPGMGKSSLALSIATHAATCGHGVGFISLEMDAASLASRAISEATALQNRPVPYSAVRRGTVSDREFDDFRGAAKDISELPISFTPPQCRDLESIYSSAKRMQKLFASRGTPLGLLVVDYVQLVRAGRKTRFEEVTEISIALKSMALTLGVPVLALSQLNRGVDNRDDHRPMTSDLRESGQLEQDADVILFCYRAEHYLARKSTDDMESIEIQAHYAALDAVRGKMEIIVDKQRNGDTGTVVVRFDPATNFVRGIGA